MKRKNNLKNLNHFTRRNQSVRCGDFLIKLSLFAAFAVFIFGNQAAAFTSPSFSYDELVQLYEQKNLPAPLAEKLQTLLTTPFVDNGATARGVRPVLPQAKELGRFVRVVEWNIERGLEFDAIKLAFTDPQAFDSLIDKTKYPEGSEKRKMILQQAAILKDADVIIFNEADWGMKRSDYRNVAAELAAAMNMNYAYGVEFVEVDPIALGTEKFEELPPKKRAEIVGEISVDRSRHKGMHGTAILSRFPLENVRLEPFEHQPHNWYRDELKSVRPLEKGKRKAGELIFQEKVRREVRRGGRMMLTAEIADERLPGGRVTVVATHLESKSNPKGRRKQLEELLERIKNINHPVIVAGDMNTSTQDGTPLSIKRVLKNRLGSKSFWIEQGLNILTGVKMPTVLLGGMNALRKQADPTVRHIPLIASNPEAAFFDKLEDFRFADGGAFDFRGEKSRSIGEKGDTLANSNQRGSKGFITTYKVNRTIAFVGKFKLDWIFVKPPGLTEPNDDDQPYRFAPHFGRTLQSLNEAIKDNISDHAPIAVDLPLNEPRIGTSNKKTRAKKL